MNLAEATAVVDLTTIRVGISSCLLGEQVRYDGGHKHSPLLEDTLGRLVPWVPVCPEVGAGFSTPPEPMRLMRDPSPRATPSVRLG